MALILLISIVFVPIILKPVVAYAFGPEISIGLWLLSFFSQQPIEQHQSNGSYVIEIKVPDAWKEILSGGLKKALEYLYPKDRETGEAHSSGNTHNLILHCPTRVFINFPTFCRDTKIKWSFDGGVQTGTIEKPPFWLDVPTNDKKIHSIECIPDAKGIKGSISFTYRCNDLAGYYAEFQAEKNWGKLMKKAFVEEMIAEQMPKSENNSPDETATIIKSKVKIQLLESKDSLNPITAYLTVEDMSGKVFAGMVTGGQEIEVIPGNIQITTNLPGLASMEVDKEGKCYVAPGSEKFVKIYRKSTGGDKKCER